MQVDVFPFVPVAVHTTVVVPTEYVPEALAVPLKLLVNVGAPPPQGLLTVGVGTVTLALHCPFVLPTIILAPQVIEGALIVAVTGVREDSHPSLKAAA